MASSKFELLDAWFEELIYPGNVDDFVHKIRHVKDEFQELKELAFYTETHKYYFVACDRDKDDGYLGCQVSARKFRAGEDWIRGNDLPDGDFNEDTWNRIMKAIINYELVILSDHTKPIVDTPEDIF